MIKAAFFDIDWTLLSHKQNCVPKSASKAINQLLEKGIKCIIATGRNYYEFKTLPIFHIKFNAYIIINGGICLDENRNTLWCESFKNAEAILQLFNSKEVPTMLVDQEDCYINFVNDYVRDAMTNISTPVPRVDTYKGKDICQAVMFLDKTKMPKYKQALKNFNYYWWHDYSIDISKKNISKLSGVKRYCKLFNIKQSEVMAFGDGENDLDMVEWAEYGVAMGNGDNKVKDAANFVTKDIDEDGIEYALKYFNLI